MTIALNGYNFFAITYFDDILIFVKNFKIIRPILETILEWARQHGLTLKQVNFLTESYFLGILLDEKVIKL